MEKRTVLMKGNPSVLFNRIPWPLLAGLLLPMLIGILGPYCVPVLRWLIFGLAWFAPVVVALMILIDRSESGGRSRGGVFRYLSLMPGGVVYNTDLEKREFPIVTLFLIIVNILLFFASPEELVAKYVFYPHGDPSFIQSLTAFFAHAFFHADISHLLGNMLFLWVFGSVVEGRVGALRYLGLYFLFIAASNYLTIILQFGQALVSDDTFSSIITNSHALGASGAISGVMGLFAIRCYFSKVTMAIPFFLVPFLSFP